MFFCYTAQSQQPGELLELQFGDKTKQTAFTLRFRYCPTGNLLEVDENSLNKYKKDSVRLQGFWISETELSQANYNAVLKLAASRQATKKLNLPTIEELMSRGGKWQTNPKKGENRLALLRDSDKPVLGLTVVDAVRICLILSLVHRESNALANKSQSLVEREVRLPSFHEWQYACRAIAGTNFPIQHLEARRHFHSWPEDPKKEYRLLKDRYRSFSRTGGDLKDMFSDGDDEANFDGSQDALLRVLSKSKGVERKRRKALFVLYHFLRSEVGAIPSFGINVNNKSLSALPVRERFKSQALHSTTNVSSMHTNHWNIHYMHGNATEWTIDTEASNHKISQAWEILSNVYGNGTPFSAISAAKDLVFRLTGGGFRDVEYERFTIWDGEKRTHDQALKTLNAVSGIRLVMTSRLSDTWRFFVRSQTLRNVETQANTAAALNDLAELRWSLQTAASASAGHPLEDLDYYASWVRYQRDANTDELRDSLLKYGKTLKNENIAVSRFLSKLASVVSTQKQGYQQ